MWKNGQQLGKLVPKPHPHEPDAVVIQIQDGSGETVATIYPAAHGVRIISDRLSPAAVRLYLRPGRESMAVRFDEPGSKPDVGEQEP